MCPSENSASVRAGAECPLSEVPLYCVSEMGVVYCPFYGVGRCPFPEVFLYSF